MSDVGDEALGIDDVVVLGDEEAPEPPPPYEFDPTDVEPAARRLDAAFAESGPASHWSDVVDHLRGAPPSAETAHSQASLDRALQTPVLYLLRLSVLREPTGCQLRPQMESEAFAYPARVGEVPEPEV